MSTYNMSHFHVPIGRRVIDNVTWFWFHLKDYELSLFWNVVQFQIEAGEHNWLFALDVSSFVGMFLLPSSNAWVVVQEEPMAQYSLHFGTFQRTEYGEEWQLSTKPLVSFDTLPECEAWVMEEGR